MTNLRLEAAHVLLDMITAADPTSEYGPTGDHNDALVKVAIQRLHEIGAVDVDRIDDGDDVVTTVRIGSLLTAATGTIIVLANWLAEHRTNAGKPTPLSNVLLALRTTLDDLWADE